MRIGSLCAIAGRGKPSVEAPAAAAVPRVSSRRVKLMASSLPAFAVPSKTIPSLLKLGNIVAVEGEAPAGALGHERLAVTELELLAIELREPGHVFEIGRVRERAEHLDAHFREEMARH